MVTRTCLVLFVAAALLHAQSDTPPFLKPTWDAGKLREEFRGKAARMMLSFWLMDRNHHEGLGASDRTRSGELAWGESSWLMNYVMCYQAFRDTYWLDKIVDHFDRMMGSLSDPEGDGFLAWRDRGYSVGLVRLTAKKNADGLTLDPETSRQWVTREGDKVTGHNYSIAFPAPDKMEIRDETDHKTLATKEYKAKAVIQEIPGSKFTISGEAKAGARFEFDSKPGEEIEYQVHDGMITYPIAQFIEIVFRDPALHAKYKAKADKYLAFIDKHVRQKWEPTWVELPNQCGAYVFTANETQRAPKALLPHNQFLAPARTFIVLKDVEGVPNREIYLEKTTKMARYFKNNLRQNGSAYVWNYWDPFPAVPDIRLNIEDTGHGTIDIGFACEACNRGVLFTNDDLTKFSNTYADVMWNQSEDDPMIAGVVDGHRSKRDGRTIHEWAKLAQWNPKVWHIATRIQEKAFSSGDCPTILYTLAGLVGIDAAEIEQFRTMRAEIEKGLAVGKPVNCEFELGALAGEPPLGWVFGVWSKSQGRTAWVEPGRNSKGAIMLEGISGEVNVVAYPTVQTKVDKPTKFRLSVYYRTEGDAKPQFSFCGSDGVEAKAKQYDHSPELEKSSDWKEATWEATSADGIKEVYFMLRNHGVGKVFYDDFQMQRVTE